MTARARAAGMTVIELIIVVAVAGILLAVGALQLNPTGSAVSQAAEVVAGAANRARFEAVKSNSTSGYVVTAGTGGSSGTITICREIDITIGLSCANGTVTEVITFEGGALARAVISAPASTSVFFDRRGVVRNPAQHVITVADRSGGHSRTITIAPTGRAEVN